MTKHQNAAIEQVGLLGTAVTDAIESLNEKARLAGLEEAGEASEPS